MSIGTVRGWLAGLVGALLAGAGVGSAASQTCTHPAGAFVVAELGDVNGSGSRNVADAICVVLGALAEAAGGSAAAVGCVMDARAADLNCDGSVDLLDAQTCIALSLQLGVPPALLPDAAGCPAACASCVPPGQGSCLIGGLCVPEGAREAEGSCEVCIPAAHTTAYSSELCEPYFLDGDDDGFGVDGDSVCQCESVGSYRALTGGDCDDEDPNAYPDGVESCDGVDNDCDGQTDEVGCAGDGGTPQTAAQSCRSILAAGGSPADGAYWLDPDGAGGDEPFEAWCDMTNDGGGWILVLRGKGGETGSGWGTTGEYNPQNASSFDGTFKFSDSRIHQLRRGGIYRFTGDGGFLVRTSFVSSGCVYAHTTNPVDGHCTDSWSNPELTSGATEGDVLICPWHQGISDGFCGGSQPHMVSHHNHSPGVIPSHWAKNTGSAFCLGTEVGCNIALWVREPDPAVAPRRNCKHIRDQNESTGDGVYLVDPDLDGGLFSPFLVWCDMTEDGGGWTLVARGLGGDTSGWENGQSAQLTRALAVGGTFKFSDTLINALRSGGRYRVITDGFFARRERYASESCVYAHNGNPGNGPCSDSWADPELTVDPLLRSQVSCPWHMGLSDAACDGGGPSPNTVTHHDDSPSSIPDHWTTSPNGTAFCRGTQANCNLELWVR